jgi:nicotinate-nucleotide adenylyltransferase
VKVGVVGGTFDPIHLGHTAMAEGARECAGLDRVLLVPAADPPHRPAAIAPPGDRLEMSRLAVQDHPSLEVSDIELRRGGPSYTVDTLEELAAELPGAEVYLALGWDAARELPSWHEPGRVLELARLIVVTRPGYPEPDVEEIRRLGLDPERVVLCRVHTPDVDATTIRERAAQGESLRGMVDPAVAMYLKEHGLYARERA